MFPLAAGVEFHTACFRCEAAGVNHMNVWRVCSLVLLCAHATNARTAAENPSFMLVSGITATEEMCLTVADGACISLPVSVCAC